MVNTLLLSGLRQDQCVYRVARGRIQKNVVRKSAWIVQLEHMQKLCPRHTLSGGFVFSSLLSALSCRHQLDTWIHFNSVSQ